MAELKAGWQRVKFGEVVRQVKDKVDPEESGLTRFVAGEHMDTDDLRIRRWGEIGDGYLGPAFHMRFKPGQVLYGSRRTYLRKVAVPDFEGICANTTFVLESSKPEVLLPELLPFVMTAEAFHEHSRRESKGSVNPYVNYSDLAWYEFELPPVEEQRRITSILGAIVAASDSQADLTESSIKLLDSLIRHQDAHLPRIRLGDIYQITGGYAFKSADYSEQGVPLMRIGNIDNGKVNINESTKLLPHSFLESFAEYRVDNGDLLVGLSGATTGKSGIYSHSTSSLLNQRVARLRIRHDYASEDAFFRYSLGLAEGTILKIAGGSAQPNISTGLLAAVEIGLPSQRERKAISEIINGLEESRLRSAAKAGLLKYMAQKLLAS
jgi:type I restriction enzyme S subunit